MAVPAVVASFGYIALGKQTLAGTAVAPTIFFPWQSMKSLPKFSYKVYHDGATRDAILPTKQIQYAEFTWAMLARPLETTGLLAYYLGGTDAVAGGGDPYTHTQTSGNNSGLLVSMEYSQGNGQDAIRTTDCLISQVKFTAKAPEALMVDAAAVGRIPVPGQTPATVSYSTDRALVTADATPAYGSGLTLGSGFTTQFVLDLKKSVAIIAVMGTQAPQLLSQIQDVMVDFDLLVADTKPFRDIFFGGDAATAVVNSLTNIATMTVNFDIGGSPDHSLQLLVNNVQAIGGDPSFDLNGKEFTISGKGQAVVSGATQVFSYSSKFNQAAAF